MAMMPTTLAGLLAMVDQACDELVELHQALVRIPTVNTGQVDGGNEIAACRLLAGRFAAAGIPYRIFEPAPGRGTILAHVGQQPRPRLLIMAHTDVVPADPAHWSFPPFSGELRADRVWGRGSDDCKASVAAGAMALILLQRAGVPLAGDLRYLAAADEETGGDYGVGWLAQHEPGEVQADWAVNEGGGLPLRAGAGPVPYLISLGEKGRVEAHIELAGREGHAAIPWAADNPLFRLGALLQRIREWRPEVDVSLPVFAPLRLYGIATEPGPENLDQLLADLERRDRETATQLRCLSRMTLAPTMATAGQKANSVPGTCRLVCDIRNLPHQGVDYVQRQLASLTEGIPGVSTQLKVTSAANMSPFDDPFVSVVGRAAETALGQPVALVPTISKGGTDSRWVRPLGTRAYGFVPMHPQPDLDRSGVHGVDESYSVADLLLLARLHVTLAYLALAQDQVH